MIRNGTSTQVLLPGEDSMEQNFDILREKGLDVDAALSFTGNDSRYIKALTRYYNAYEKNSARIKNSYDNKDYEDYTIIVHSLKSNSRMIGDNELGDLAEKLQYAGQDKDVDLIEAETENLLTKYKELVDLIEPFVDNSEEDRAKADALKLSNELKSAIEDFDYNKSVEIYDKLSHVSMHASNKMILQGIKTKLDEFMYEEAAQAVGDLIIHLQGK